MPTVDPDELSRLNVRLELWSRITSPAAMNRTQCPLVITSAGLDRLVLTGRTSEPEQLLSATIARKCATIVRER